MLIAGAGGHAREIFDVLKRAGYLQDICLFEEFETAEYQKWSIKINIVRAYDEVKALFQKNARFALGVGNPKIREQLYIKLSACGGIAENIISTSAIVSTQGVGMGDGLNIMELAFVSNNVRIGKGTLVNAGARIHHDCEIGDFCEISPNATVAGGCILGNNCSIGASATILPKIRVGNNVIIGAGSVLTKDVPANHVVAGVPAKIIREI